MTFYSRRPLWMRHTADALSNAPRTSISEFQPILSSSSRILALCGAGLSASSGLPTFRGAGGLWRNHPATTLGTPEAFEEDPALVWLFYAWRRHMALAAKPNSGHFALAELAKKKKGFMCLTQNVDGLSTRAGHPPAQLCLLHGNIASLRCFNECGYVEPNNRTDPLCAALALASEDYPPDQTFPLLDPSTPTPNIRREDLPQCPQCKQGLLRPDVVWFGEALDEEMLMGIDSWISKGKVDLMLLVGTSAAVQPAANYVRQAQKAGAILVVINSDSDAKQGLRSRDFFFQGDAAQLLPEIFEDVIGKLCKDGVHFEETTGD